MDFILNTVLPFVVALSIIVFVHEYGHYWVAIRNKVKIEVFSIGFGKEIIGWTDKRGTRWKFCMIPLGGYVKMYGDANAASQPGVESTLTTEEKAKTLQGKTPLQRIAVASAGPIANFIFAVFVFLCIFNIRGVPSIPPIIGEVLKDSVAERDGLKPKDKIISINDHKINDFFAIKQHIMSNVGKTIIVKVERDQKIKEISVVLLENGKKKVTLGIKPTDEITYEKSPFTETVSTSFFITKSLIMETLWGFSMIITGQTKSADIGGIITIGDAFSKAANEGIWAFLQLMAWISIQLGVINLFPIPLLDGGHIMMNTIELIIRRPLNEKMQTWFYRFGAVFVLGLMSYGILNDLVRYKVLGKVLGLFGIQ